MFLWYAWKLHTFNKTFDGRVQSSKGFYGPISLSFIQLGVLDKCEYLFGGHKNNSSKFYVYFKYTYMGSYQKTYMVHAILSEYIVRRPMYSGRPFIPLGHSSHMTEHNCCVNVIGFCLAWYLFCYPRHHPSWVPLTMAQGIVHRCENYISCSKRRRGGGGK